MKFKAGDRFRIIENGITGQIYAVFNANGVMLYCVLWDTLSRSGSYIATQVDSIWELIETPPILEFIEFKDTGIRHHKSLICQHKWATYVGLFEVFQYCEKCDIKKE